MSKRKIPAKWQNMGTTDGTTEWVLEYVPEPAPFQRPMLAMLQRETPTKLGAVTTSGRGGFPSVHRPLVQDRQAPKTWRVWLYASAEDHQAGDETEITLADGLTAPEAKAQVMATLERLRPGLLPPLPPKKARPPARQRLAVTLPPELLQWVHSRDESPSTLVEQALEWHWQEWYADGGAA